MKKHIICAILTLGLALSAQAQTSENNSRLKRALKRFPAADANGDGELTMEEGKAFQDRQSGQSNQEEPKAKPKVAQAPEGGETMIYKKVGDVELPLYIYKPEGHNPNAKAPAIVFFFGGGWQNGNPSQFEHQCKHLASRGMVAITVEYRVGSRHKAKIEDCVEDAKSAMRWVRQNASKLGVDPKRIASSGGSAGAHLAACVALVDDMNAKSDDTKVSAKPNAMVLFNPPMVMAEHERLSDEVNALLRERGEERKFKTRGPRAKISPLTYATQKQPPCIIFFGSEDRLLAGAEIFRDASKEAGNTCGLMVYEGQGHGFFNHGRGGKYYDLTLNEADKFLVDLGWIEKQGGK